MAPGLRWICGPPVPPCLKPPTAWPAVQDNRSDQIASPTLDAVALWVSEAMGGYGPSSLDRSATDDGQ